MSTQQGNAHSIERSGSSSEPSVTRRQAIGALAGIAAAACGYAFCQQESLVERAFASESSDASSLEDLPVNYTEDQLATATSLIQQTIAAFAETTEDPSLGSLTVACVRQAFRNVNDDPEYYYLVGELNLTYVQSVADENDCYVHSITLSYTVTKEEFPQYALQFESSVTNALSWVNSAMDTVECAKALHDYLVRHVSYDSATQQTMNTSDRSPYSAFGALVKGSAVCDGYAHAYELLLRRLGIGVLFAVSDPMNHSWNMVNVDSGWYHVDVTWDDPVPDQGPDAPVYSYAFLRSDDAMKELEHYGWTADATAPNDYDWQALYGDIEYSSPASTEVAVADPYLFADASAEDPYVTDGALDELISRGIVHYDAEQSASGVLGWLHPSSSLTREQLALMLYRTAKTYPDSYDLSSYLPSVGNASAVSADLLTIDDIADVDGASSSAPAIFWCVNQGIMSTSETDDGTYFLPGDPVLRQCFAQAISLFFSLGFPETDASGATADSATAASATDSAAICDFNALADRAAADPAMTEDLTWAFAKGILTSQTIDGLERAMPVSAIKRSEAFEGFYALVRICDAEASTARSAS
jgi:hypothetical protein